MIEPLPCPFCGAAPELGPKHPEREGDAWGYVECVNVRCPTWNFGRGGVRVVDAVEVADNRGVSAYQQTAIARWNRRYAPNDFLSEALNSGDGTYKP